MKGKNDILGGGGFHHIALKVKDFEYSVGFYTEVLGFRSTISWGDGDNRAVMLDSGDGSCLEIFAGGSVEKKPEGAILHIALRTADCRVVLEKVREAGMEITVEPKDVNIPSSPPTPVTIAFFKGPDGEIIELFENRK
jgi:catechol 2,3-dioxygenase-like lactoylglutathione lyase family enzyme